MDELSRKFRSIDWKGLQKSARKMQASTASALKDMVMTDLENKVRAATADTSWGASGSDLMQIAQGTFNREDYALIMSIVWQRLGSSRWRCVYKALEVLRHLIMHGASRCAEEARAALHHLQTLTYYRHVDPATHRDCGEGVRTRAKLVCDMLADDAVLEDEREKSRHLRAKLQGGVGGPASRMGGMSSDDYRYGVGGDSAADYGPTVRTTATAAGNFKGYADDDTQGAYDDAPAGTFAKRAAGATGTAATAAAAADMPDLLGDADPGEDPPAPGFGDEDDDDDFDPRGGAASAQPPAMVGDDDLFGALALTTTNNDTAAPAHLGEPTATTGPPAGQMPTSLLIQNLAKQQGQLQVQAPVQAPQSPATDNAFAADLGAAGSSPFGQTASAQQATNGFGFAPSAQASSTAAAAAGFADDGAPAATPVRPAKTVVTSKPDTDPFGDLLVSAKKSGVL